VLQLALRDFQAKKNLKPNKNSWLGSDLLHIITNHFCPLKWALGQPARKVSMRIKCRDCGFSEEVNLDLFVKILGGATAGFGFWAWTSFLFAGTGFAMAICIAIITGGAAMLAYKDEIIDWIANEGHECDSCGSQNWAAISPEKEKEINAQEKYQRKITASLELRTRIDTAEDLLRSEGIEFEKTENSWLILEPLGNLKKISGISELELYVGSL
jgi:hypothetical protein